MHYANHFNRLLRGFYMQQFVLYYLFNRKDLRECWYGWTVGGAVTTQSWSPINNRRRAGIMNRRRFLSGSASVQASRRNSLWISALLRHQSKCPARIKRRTCPSASSRFCPSWSAAAAGQDPSGAPRKLPEKRPLYSAESPRRPAGATPVSKHSRSDQNPVLLATQLHYIIPCAGLLSGTRACGLQQSFSVFHISYFIFLRDPILKFKCGYIFACKKIQFTLWKTNECHKYVKYYSS